MVERVRLRRPISSVSLLTESAERLEATRDKLKAVLVPKKRLEEIYFDQSFHASNTVERLQRAPTAIINKAIADALFSVLMGLAVERGRAVALVEQWMSADPSARSEVSVLLEEHALDESAIEAEAILNC